MFRSAVGSRPAPSPCPGRRTLASFFGPLPFLALVSVGCRSRAAPSRPLTIAAAADLAFAFSEVGRSFEEKTGTKVNFSFGSTGLLARQIAEGAPFDLFAAANRSFVDGLVEAGVCDGASTTLYARGRLVAWTNNERAAPKSLAELVDPRFVKIAIANPEHAPYGRAARQALTRAGVWKAVAPKIVFGENVQQALQFAESGNADVALVALSLVLTSGGSYLTLEAGSYDPLDQALVVCGHAQEAEARKFAEFVGSPAGRAIMGRYGFLPPSEAPAPPAPARDDAPHAASAGAARARPNPPR